MTTSELSSFLVISSIDAKWFRSYESLPPNFSLAQNMAAGAFAGIAVRPKLDPLELGDVFKTDSILSFRSILPCIPSMRSRYNQLIHD